MNIVFGLNLMDQYHNTSWSQKTTHISHSGCMNIISRLNLMDQYHHTPWPQKTTHISHSWRTNIISGLNLMDQYRHMPWSCKITNISHSRYMGILSGFERWECWTWWPSTSCSHHRKHQTSITVEEWKLSLGLKVRMLNLCCYKKRKKKASATYLMFIFVILHLHWFTVMILNIQRPIHIWQTYHANLRQSKGSILTGNKKQLARMVEND